MYSVDSLDCMIKFKSGNVMLAESFIASKVKDFNEKRMVIVDNDGNKTYRMIDVSSKYPPSCSTNCYDSEDTVSKGSECFGQRSTNDSLSYCSVNYPKSSRRRCAIKYKRVPVFMPRRFHYTSKTDQLKCSDPKKRQWKLLDSSNEDSHECNVGRRCIRSIRPSLWSIESLRLQEAPLDRSAILNHRAVAPLDPLQLRRCIMLNELNLNCKTTKYRKFVEPFLMLLVLLCIYAGFYYWDRPPTPPPPSFRDRLTKAVYDFFS